MDEFVVQSIYTIRDAKHLEELIKNGLCQEQGIDRETLYWRMYECYLSVGKREENTYKIVEHEEGWIAIQTGRFSYIYGEGDTPDEALADHKAKLKEWKESRGIK